MKSNLKETATFIYVTVSFLAGDNMALININYESKTLGMPVMINAIIPQGRGNYKTLYLLHGMGGDYTTWITKSRVADYVDNTDIAVIMISGDNKCFVDNVHGRKYFTFLTEELIKTCTNWFGLSCDRKDRYIAGMSMGGYGAVHAALIKPDVYGKVFSYSGLLDIEKRFDNPQGINTYQIFGDREKLSDIRGEVSDNGWGNQIRSYVMQPYTMVKDHRTGEETGNVQSVMDGNLDAFMNAYLRWITTPQKA